MGINEAVDEQMTKQEIDFSVSEDLAMKMAAGFFSTDSSFVAARVAPNAVKIREIEKVKLDEAKSFEAYLVNEQNGFMIISGDSRIMPVLAFSPTGSIIKEDLYEVNGLKIWFANTMEQIEDELKVVESVHPIVYGEWKKYTEDFDPRVRLWEHATETAYNHNCYEWYQYGQHMCNPYFTLQESGPLYSNDISWGQSGISNYGVYSHPLVGCSQNCGRSPIGCGPVAIAQTVWHYKRNQSYYSSMPQFSWDKCTPTTQGEHNLAALMFSAAVSSYTDFYFSLTCNGMTLPINIRPALTSLGMQSNGSISTFNPNVLRNELAQGYPAIFYGHDNLLQWHIWTSYGHRRHNYKTYNCNTDSCVEWHYQWFFMNWGWNGKKHAYLPDNDPDNKNGWYASGVFQPTGSNTNYNNNLRMITGIR